MRKALVLVIWLLGVLFPAAWLGQFSTAYRGVFIRIFGPEWTHVCMHLLIYAVLAVLLRQAAVFPGQRGATSGSLDRRLALRLMGLVLVVGFIQESLQWLSQGVVPWQGIALFASLFDLGVDLSGGLLGMGMVNLWHVYHPE